jgi:hypothetical protein
MTRAEIMTLIEAERERQAEKWHGRHAWGSGDCSELAAYSDVVSDRGQPQYDRLVKAAVLAEEAGEAVKAALDVEPEQFRTEVIQTAAVALAILEGLPS